MFHDSADGNPIREKYRIRIYNDSFDTIKLEVKRKKYNYAVKIVSEISREELNFLMAGEEIPSKNSAHDARTLFNIAVKTRGLRPRVIITYERMAYVFEPGNVRITFDRNIRASAQCRMFGEKEIVYDHPDGIGSVLEVKYDQFVPKFIMQILENGNMIQTANSKYGLCREIYERGTNI